MSRFIFTISLMLLLFGGVSAGIIKVPENYATIQAGIDAALKGDTVLVNSGTYYENINFKGKAITVTSYFCAEGDTDYINSTIINGSRPSDPNKGSVVSFTSGEDTTSVICGFTITGGTGSLYDSETRVGGGVYCKNSGARISHNKIIGNAVTHNKGCDGGGIGYWPQTTSIARYVIIEDNIVESNSITSSNGGSYLNGGGIHIVKGRVTGNTIRYNSVSGQPIFAGGGGISAVCENTATRTLVVIAGNTITHNQARTPGYYGGWGGGIDVVMCNVQILDNTITHNETGGSWGMGAGIRLWGSKASSIIKNNTISSNSVTAPGGGGGIELDQTEGVQVIGNRIEGNNGYGGGGGIDESRSSPGNLIKGNFIKNNSGGEGGGIWAMNSIIINNIIVENKARRNGGIYYYYHPSFGSKVAQIINNTLTKNVADTAGSIAIYRANAVVMNTISWGNSAPHGSEIELWGGTLNAAHSDIQFGASGIVIDSTATVNWLAGNINTNPLFEYSSYQLSNSSPCIGAGTEGIMIGGTGYYCPGDDFAGNPRPNPIESTTPDIGAYEHPLDKPSGPILVPEQYATIQAGINAAKAGEIVLVKDGTYYENINFKGKAITVASYYLMDGDTTHINNTIIDGSKPSHADSGSVVYFIAGEDTTSVLCGFTITGGSGTETSYWDSGTQIFGRAGGGIFCYNSGARIVNNKIINNVMTSPDKRVLGGGIAALPFESTAYVVLRDNRIMHNTVTANTSNARGGGVEIHCNARLTNNLISYNSVVHNATTTQATGGGLDCRTLSSDRRTLIMDSNEITHNSVVGKSTSSPSALGGGVTISRSQGRFSKNKVSHNELSVGSNENASGAGMEILGVPESFIIEGNIISENAVTNGNGYGGGINVADQASPTFINNIIERNSATNGGGFLITGNSVVKLINNTIVNNLATSGGGICLGLSNSTNYLMNSIIWGNQAATNPAIHIYTGTITVAYSDIQGGWSGTWNFNADPLFADTLFHLSDGSPCIGKGIASFDFGGGMMCYSPVTDISGNSRPNPAGSKPDIGAYESPLATEVINFAETKIPQSYFLAQNYPNPFNPSTTIEFAIPKSAFVTLKVYNLLGEEVATLVAEQREAGIHKLNWDAKGLASGVYLYQLEAGSFKQSKKLILMR
jgi:hypothetical protein